MMRRSSRHSFIIALIVCFVAISCSDNPDNQQEVLVDPAAETISVVPAGGQPIQRFTRDKLSAQQNSSTSDFELPVSGPWIPLNGSSAEFRDGVLVVEANEKPAFIQFPIRTELDWYRALEVEMRVDAGSECLFKWATTTTPDFALNSGIYEPVVADGGFHTYTFDLSHYSVSEWSGELSAIEFWPVSDVPANAEIRSMKLLRGTREAPRRLTLVNQTHEAVFGAQAPWRIHVPNNGQLSVHYGMLDEPAVRYGGDGARFSVLVHTNGGNADTLFERVLDPIRESTDRGWQFVQLNLDAYAGQEIDVEFNVDSLSNPLGDFAFWGSPVVFGPGRQDDAPPVIFISLDTLRADHLSAYGYARKTSPNIDRLVEDAVLFEHAITPEPWTLPSHMTMFTGLYPKNHGVTGNALLPESRLTLGDALSNAGYISAGFTGLDWWLMPFRGFAQGFDLYNHARPTSRHIYATMPLVMDWLRQHDTNRFFLFFHAFDIHSKVHSMDSFQLPYETGDPAMVHFAEGMTVPTFERDGLETRATHYLQRGNEKQLEPTQEELDYMIAVYDDCIRMVDIKLGELFESLRERGLYDDALIVLLSDHGESFFEHDKFLHQTVYEENCRVPLIIKLPGNLHAGRRVADQVVLTDVLPTFLDVLDIETTAQFDGRSLLPVIEDRASPHPLAYIQREDQRAVRTNGIKQIQYIDGAADECFDLLHDPNESSTVCDTVPEEAKALFDQAHAAFFTVPSGGWHIAFTNGDAIWNSRLTISADARITKVAFIHADRRDETLIQQRSDVAFVAELPLAIDGEEECVVAIERAAGVSDAGSAHLTPEQREQLESIGYGGGEIDATIATGSARLTITSDLAFRVNGATDEVTSFSERLDPADPKFAPTASDVAAPNGPHVRIWYSPPASDQTPAQLTDEQAVKLGETTLSN